MIKKLIIAITFLVIPSLVFAESYTATFESGYTYGNVIDCDISSEIKDASVKGYDVCLSRQKSHTLYGLKCEDADMESFSFVTSNSYYGYGCRKVDDYSKVEFKQFTINEGEAHLVVDSSDYNCSIIGGDGEGSFNSNNKCSFEAKKAGTVRIKVVNKKTLEAKYYEYEILKSSSSISELDSNYVYGSVDECDLGQGDKKIEIEPGIYFCGIVQDGYNYGVSGKGVTCVNDDYDAFQVDFKINGNTYKGYGCRKIKNADDLEYIKKTIYAGTGESVTSGTNNTCTIISGNGYGTLNVNNECWLDAQKEGIVRIKVKDNTNSTAKYYEYEIVSAPSTIDDLDDAYYYSNVDKCALDVPSEIVTFDGYKFCGTTTPGGFTANTSTATCHYSNYELFEITFRIDNNIYHGYGCRKLIETSSGGADITPGEMNCDSLLGSPDEKGDPAYYLSVAFDVIKYAAIVLLIALTIMDFVGAITSQDQEILNKCLRKALIRLALCVVIFLLPTLIDFILTFIHDREVSTCGIG